MEEPRKDTSSQTDIVSENKSLPENDTGSENESLSEDSELSQPKKREFRGLYKHVHIPVKALDAIIIVCLVVIVVFLVIDLQNPGFTITFDSKGGTDVAPHNQMYGEHLKLPEPPTREGYRFTGWYTDYACYEAWDIENDVIQSDITLYAGWEPVSN